MATQKSEHTAGPWRLVHDFGAYELRKGVTAVVGAFGNGRLIYIVPEFMVDAESAANARLIAAAPELYVLVVEDLCNHSIDHHGGADDYTCSYCNQRRAAIAHARGQS